MFLSIWNGTTESLHNFFEAIHKIHPNIKFTMQHTTSEEKNPVENIAKCKCKPTKSIPFLDTSCSIQDAQIVVDLYKKPTDRNQYLLTNSCHPPECTTHIPYSLALRITRICT